MSTRANSQADGDVFELLEEVVSYPTSSRVVIGHLLGVNDNGEPLISYDDETARKPLVALNALSIEDVESIQSFPLQVIVTFEADNGQAVISGLVKRTLFSMDVLARKSNRHDAKDSSLKSQENITKTLPSTLNPLHAEIDGKKIVLSGKEEILLQCGKSSILMRRDGKIVIKGDNITSRSSSQNKIKGSSVSIN